MVGRLAAALGLAISMAAATPAAAQRGAGFIVQDEIDQGPRTGFPGMFDTTTVGRGKLVQSYPWLGADYGLTENVSIGTSGLFLTPNLAGSPSAMLRSRYRIFSGPRFTGVIDGSVFVSLLRGDDQTITTNYGLIGGNAAYRLSPRNSIAGALHVAQFGFSAEEDGDETDRLTFRATIAALTHEFIPNHWFSLRTSLVHAPQVTAFIDSIGATADIRSRGVGGALERTGLRVLTSFRRGRWLFTAGGVLAAGAPVPLPYFSVARIYR